jgi:hypothetical protein
MATHNPNHNSRNQADERKRDASTASQKAIEFYPILQRHSSAKELNFSIYCSPDFLAVLK